MRSLSVAMLAFVASCLLSGCDVGGRSDVDVVGTYRADNDKSRILLSADGTFSIEERSTEVHLRFLVFGGRWTHERNQVTLSWWDTRAATMPPHTLVYTLTVKHGIVILRLSPGQRLPIGHFDIPMGVQIQNRYTKMPNQAVQRTPATPPSLT